MFNKKKFGDEFRVVLKAEDELQDEIDFASFDLAKKYNKYKGGK